MAPSWDGVSDVGRANEEHLGQVERHVLSAERSCFEGLDMVISGATQRLFCWERARGMFGISDMNF